MNRLLVLVSFVVLTPITLFITIIAYEWHTFTLTNGFFAFASYKQPEAVQTYTALPNLEAQFAVSVGIADSRIDRIRSFFLAYHSPLADYAEKFVEDADTYNLDFRLLPAISMQESQGGKKVVKDTNNPFGWGITSKKTLKFENYGQAIDTVSKFMGKSYVGKGLNTPEEIGKKYNPTDTNGWIAKITYFMNQI